MCLCFLRVQSNSTRYRTSLSESSHAGTSEPITDGQAGVCVSDGAQNVPVINLMVPKCSRKNKIIEGECLYC